jgi:hypothetical protein
MVSRIGIHVISTDVESHKAGHSLTQKYIEWQEQNPSYVVLNAHSTSNDHGWMITIKYEKYSK